MANKFPGAHSAVGYWGRSPWCRIQQEQVGPKVAVLLLDKLVAQGKSAYLYLPKSSGTVCSCVKDTTTNNDALCVQCYGTGFAGGYERFLHETMWQTASEAGNWTLTNTYIDTSIKPYRVMLSTGQITGTAVTDDKAYTNTPNEDWETHTDIFLRDAGSTSTVEFSTDSGASWTALASINGVNKPSSASGTIRFRITLTRSSSNARSPAIEAVRIRRVKSELSNTALQTQRHGTFGDGQILLLRPWIQEQASLYDNRGITTEWLGDKTWTVPLNVFDSSITPETPQARIAEPLNGPHPFFEWTSGIRTGERVVLATFKYNEEFGVFTHQEFDDRRAQMSEVYSVVF